MNNQNDLFYNTPPLTSIIFDDLDNELNDTLYLGDLGDEVPILEFDLSDLDDDINLSDLEFDVNLVDDLDVFIPPSSPKSIFHAPKSESDIFDFFFYR